MDIEINKAPTATLEARYLSLDILRGLSALGIMIYHYLGWILGHFGASNTLGRFGVYGVSIFYILSGLTM
jgi:exopolysaccharide production protein ExoZ